MSKKFVVSAMKGLLEGVAPLMRSGSIRLTTDVDVRCSDSEVELFGKLNWFLAPDPLHEYRRRVFPLVREVIKEINNAGMFLAQQIVSVAVKKLEEGATQRGLDPTPYVQAFTSLVGNANMFTMISTIMKSIPDIIGAKLLGMSFDMEMGRCENEYGCEISIKFSMRIENRGDVCDIVRRYLGQTLKAFGEGNIDELIKMIGESE